MKAIIIKGKNKGKLVEISQWANDWFSLEDGRILSPTMLGFTAKDFRIIREGKNNGIIFALYAVVSTKPEFGVYAFTFKKLKQK